MKTVSFTQMSAGTKEDYDLLGKLEEEYAAKLPARLLEAVKALKTSLSGYQVTRYEHSLQSATRAYRDGRDEEYVVACLLHDIGDELAPYTHGEMTAAVLRPYVSEKLVWLVKQHPVFQLYYYGEYTGDDPNARDRFRDHPWFDEAVEFCEKYDQNCFDPAYDSLPLDFFAPMVERVFSKEPQFTW